MNRKYANIMGIFSAASLLALTSCGYGVQLPEKAAAEETVTAFSAAAPDFRETRWGMDRDEVLAAEEGEPLLNEKTEIVYSGITAAGFSAELHYFFDGCGRLWRAEYDFPEIHSDRQSYEDMYKEISAALSEKYGVPAECTSSVKKWETENKFVRLALFENNGVFSLNLSYSSKTYERFDENLKEGL